MSTRAPSLGHAQAAAPQAELPGRARPRARGYRSDSARSAGVTVWTVTRRGARRFVASKIIFCAGEGPGRGCGRPGPRPCCVGVVSRRTGWPVAACRCAGLWLRIKAQPIAWFRSWPCAWPPSWPPRTGALPPGSFGINVSAFRHSWGRRPAPGDEHAVLDDSRLRPRPSAPTLGQVVVPAAGARPLCRRLGPRPIPAGPGRNSPAGGRAPRGHPVSPQPSALCVMAASP
jgi:hypothetical protein